MRKRWLRLTVLVAVLLGVLYASYVVRPDLWGWLWENVFPPPPRPPTVEDRIKEIGLDVRRQLEASFERVGASYPPRSVALLCFKHEQMIEMWAAVGGKWERVEDIPVRAMNSEPGPKLDTEDGRIPEGRYRVNRLSAKSYFHLSLNLRFPNEQDCEDALADGRSAPGGTIHIHGKGVADQLGGIAVGDDAIDRLYMLAYDAGVNAIQVIIAPNDLRGGAKALRADNAPPWMDTRLDYIRKQLVPFSKSGP